MHMTVHQFKLSKQSQVERELNRLKDLGFCYSSFGFKSLQTSKVIGCFSHQNWADKYVSQSLFSYDPLLQTACHIENHTILWSAVSIDSSEGYQVMQQRESVSGAKSGVTLAINDGRFQEIIAIGDYDEEIIFLERFTNHFTQILEARKMLKNLLLDSA